MQKFFNAKSEAKSLQDLGWIGPDGLRASGGGINSIHLQ
jgi:hypothetical protein